MKINFSVGLIYLALFLIVISCTNTTKQDPKDDSNFVEQLNSSVENISATNVGRSIENVVFKGGGVLGIAYTGAVKALEEEGILKEVKRTAGTSAGSVIAALIAFNYNSEEIIEVMSMTNFAAICKERDDLSILTSYGLNDGDKIIEYVESFISKKTNNAKITFAEMEASGFKELRVFATDLTEGKIREFSPTKTPNTIVAEAIRASMSYPLFFEAWRFSNSIPNNHFYVDGGVTYNYPVTTFPKENTLGFYLYNANKDAAGTLEENDLPKYVEKLLATISSAQELGFMESAAQKEISVLINDFGISPLDFDLADSVKTKLFVEGFEATKSYFEQSNRVR